MYLYLNPDLYADCRMLNGPDFTLLELENIVEKANVCFDVMLKRVMQLFKRDVMNSMYMPWSHYLIAVYSKHTSNVNVLLTAYVFCSVAAWMDLVSQSY